MRVLNGADVRKTAVHAHNRRVGLPTLAGPDGPASERLMVKADLNAARCPTTG